MEQKPRIHRTLPADWQDSVYIFLSLSMTNATDNFTSYAATIAILEVNKVRVRQEENFVNDLAINVWLSQHYP